MNSLINKARAALVILAIFLPAITHAQPIEIKGLSVGMQKEDVTKLFPTFNDFTIAGVNGRYQFSPVDIEYRDNKIDTLLFLFDSESFQTVLAAVKEKYPKLKCATSQLSNAMGATFSQIQCSMENSESVLTLSRFVDLDTSCLSLYSKKYIEEENIKAKKKRRDI